MENYIGKVYEALAMMGGENARVPASDEHGREVQKAKLTRIAAYLIHQVNPNFGLLAKDTGNNIDGFSVDLIIDKTTGDFADCCTDRETDSQGRAILQPQWIQNNDPALIGRWREPTRALAGLDGISPPVVTQPPPSPPSGGGEPVLTQPDVLFVTEGIHQILAKVSGLEDKANAQARAGFVGAGRARLLGQSVTMNIDLSPAAARSRGVREGPPPAPAFTAAPKITASSIRQVLTVLGTLAVANGYGTEGQVSEIIGAVMVIGSTLWGLRNAYVVAHKPAEVQP